MYPEPKEGETISFVPQNQTIIDYLIKFQNYTGDTVRNVFVIDTIDLDIGLSYIQEIGASHEYTTRLVQNSENPRQGILIWTFENINLPPKDWDYTEMDPDFGFMSFKLKMKDNNPIGTEITNSAMIVYDYVLDKYTNEVVAEVSAPVDNTNIDKIIQNGADVFPNPATNSVKVSIEGRGIETVTILTIHGKEIYSENFNGAVEANINITDYTSGMYFIMVTGKDGTYVNKLQKK